MAQERASQDSIQSSANSFYVFPIAFYAPETDFGFGAAGIFAFRFKDEPPASRPSQVQIGLAYTLKNQVLIYFPYQLYFKNQLYYSYGEIGYYRYVYKFFGVGNGIDPDFVENYSVNFPRVRINFLKLVRPDLYAGLRYWFEDYHITERDPAGMLIDHTITGSAGGVTSGPGLVAIYDTRDNVFFPQQGAYAEGFVQKNSGLTGSDFWYTTYAVDASKYLFLENLQHVVALNAYAVVMTGEPPFNQLAMLGGPKKMRGYFEGRYRERNLLLLQAEYRAPLFWRIGLVGFASYGGVSHELGGFELANFKYTFGGGLRFLLDKEKKINIRLDAGFGRNSSGYYLTIGEAF